MMKRRTDAGLRGVKTLLKNFLKNFIWGIDITTRATGVITWEVKAKNRENAIKQVKKMAREHDMFIRKHRPDFETIIFWDTFKLDRRGHQRRF